MDGGREGRDAMLKGTNDTKLNPRKRCKESSTSTGDQTHSTHTKKSRAI